MQKPSATTQHRGSAQFPPLIGLSRTVPASNHGGTVADAGRLTPPDRTRVFNSQSCSQFVSGGENKNTCFLAERFSHFGRFWFCHSLVWIAVVQQKVSEPSCQKSVETDRGLKVQGNSKWLNCDFPTRLRSICPAHKQRWIHKNLFKNSCNNY